MRLDLDRPHGALQQAAADLLFLEAKLIDRKLWSDWLALYTEDAVFWAPAWASEEAMTGDPELELNLFYIKGRGGLEDRVFRIESRDSYASLPLPRTAHLVSNVRVEAVREDELDVSATWLTFIFDHRRGKQTHGGWYDYLLRRTSAGLRIARKKIVFLEDQIEGPIDIYHL
jgi:3-phenylpropionate/cinnamic acid dioxygenase small subunit